MQLGAEFWKGELGLDVEVRVGDSVALDEKVRTGELNGQVLWRENDTRRDATSNLASAWGDPTRSDRRHNDPELFQLVQETFQILDPDERAKASGELFGKIILKELDYARDRRGKAKRDSKGYENQRLSCRST